jgi:hypothetical protein
VIGLVKEVIMKRLLVVMIMAVLGVSALGQTQRGASPRGRCALTVAQSPEVRGIRLGMSVEEVLGLFPGSSDAPEIRSALSSADKHFGVTKFNVYPDRYASKVKFEGISQFAFEFLDNRLSAVYVGYNGPEWKSVDVFISRLSESLKLPSANDWEASNLDSLKTLKCEGFEIRASIGGTDGNSNYVLIHSLVAEQMVRDRQAEVKEKARREFKP